MVKEWQLWTYPYPTMIKNKSRRLNPARVPYARLFSDGDEFIKLKDLFEARKKHLPTQLKRCVRAITKERGGDEPTREDMSRAFAICTAQLQRSGYLKKGSQKPTKKGKTRSRSKAGEKGHKSKVAEYEKMLALVRKKTDEQLERLGERAFDDIDVDANDVDTHGMDAMTRRRLRVKRLHQKVGKKKPRRPLNTKTPYGSADIPALERSES